jgi:4-hydroxy-tetrahydrodipicolinate reductase
MTDRYRVVQWATGNIGTKSLRAVIEHPQLDLVGVYVYSDDKVGRDAAGMCGLSRPTGVVATRDIDEIVALEPDCVLYMARQCDMDDVCRLLESGANIVTTRGEFHHPSGLDSATRERVEAACARGATSIHSTGSSPGFITEALPIVLLSLERRLDALTIDEFADLSTRDSPDLLFSIMGFGKPPEKFDVRRWAHGAVAFGPSLRVLADAIGVPLDDVQSTGEVAVAARDIDIAAGTVPAGTVAAQRMVVTGTRAGHAQPLVTFRANWYCSADVEPAWGLRETGWRVQVDGDVPLDVDIRFPVAPDDYASMSPGITAHRAVNAVPVVCDAAPGIRTTLDLPNVVATFG